MILIGERINAGFKDIANAIRTKDPTAVEKWAVAQTEAGATYLDVNIGAASRDPADMAWLVETVRTFQTASYAVPGQEGVTVPLTSVQSAVPAGTVA